LRANLISGGALDNQGLKGVIWRQKITFYDGETPIIQGVKTDQNVYRICRIGSELEIVSAQQVKEEIRPHCCRCTKKQREILSYSGRNSSRPTNEMTADRVMKSLPASQSGDHWDERDILARDLGSGTVINQLAYSTLLPQGFSLLSRRRRK
jgi:hypothetical protein